MFGVRPNGSHVVFSPCNSSLTCIRPTARQDAALCTTSHGTVQTPVFMPVGTQGTVKGLTPEQLEGCGG